MGVGIFYPPPSLCLGMLELTPWLQPSVATVFQRRCQWFSDLRINLISPSLEERNVVNSHGNIGSCIFKLWDSLIVKLICPNPNLAQGEIPSWLEWLSDSGLGVVLGLKLPRFWASVCSWQVAFCHVASWSWVRFLLTWGSVWGSLTWQTGLRGEANSCQDQLRGTRLLPALWSEHPCLSFLSVSNRLLRRCVPADFLNALGWMSLTKAQAATSLSAKWEEGKYIVSNTVDQQAYLSFL